MQIEEHCATPRYMEVGVGGEAPHHTTVCRFFLFVLHGHPEIAIFNLFSQSFRQKLSVYGKGTLLCDHGNRTIYILLDLDVLYPPLRAHLEVCDI